MISPIFQKLFILRLAQKKSRSLTEREPVERIGFVCFGTLKSEVCNDKGSIILDFHKKGDLICGGSLLGRHLSPVSVVVREKARIALIEKGHVEGTLLRHREISIALMRKISEKCRTSMIRLGFMSFLNAEDRVFHFLKNMGERYGVPHPFGIHVDFSLTKLEIADSLGMTRETTTLALSNLMNKGLIVSEKRAIIIKGNLPSFG